MKILIHKSYVKTVGFGGLIGFIVGVISYAVLSIFAKGIEKYDI